MNAAFLFSLALERRQIDAAGGMPLLVLLLPFRGVLRGVGTMEQLCADAGQASHVGIDVIWEEHSVRYGLLIAGCMHFLLFVSWVRTAESRLLASPDRAQNNKRTQVLEQGAVVPYNRLVYVLVAIEQERNAKQMGAGANKRGTCLRGTPT